MIGLKLLLFFSKLITSAWPEILHLSYSCQGKAFALVPLKQNHTVNPETICSNLTIIFAPFFPTSTTTQMKMGAPFFHALPGAPRGHLSDASSVGKGKQTRKVKEPL